ncbi:hypothetical protein PS1_038648 [Malus domestica]|nr:RING-H2 finger protein ATL20-like [Malus domestica]
MATIDTFTFFLFLFFRPQSPPPRVVNRNAPMKEEIFQWFGLSCNDQRQTIPTLPFSEDFIVQNINYLDQVVTINDPDNCLPRWFFHRDLSLVIDTPLVYTYGRLNYTFLTCSIYNETWSAPLIYCLSSEKNYVIVVPTSFSLPPDQEPYHRFCTVISTTSVPRPFDWQHLDLGAQLTWHTPDCRFCESSGHVCGSKNGRGSAVSALILRNPVCFMNNAIHRSLSRAAIYCRMIRVGISVLLIVGVAIHVRDKKRASDEPRQPNMELSIITDQQPSVLTMGLDRPTIELYPKIQLGERSEFPKQLTDNTCPICLGEYRPNETLRTIPQCNHYFHANCIDEWLGRNATCPLCRLPPK